MTHLEWRETNLWPPRAKKRLDHLYKPWAEWDYDTSFSQETAIYYTSWAVRDCNLWHTLSQERLQTMTHLEPRETVIYDTPWVKWDSNLWHTLSRERLQYLTNLEPRETRQSMTYLELRETLIYDTSWAETDSAIYDTLNGTLLCRGRAILLYAEENIGHMRVSTPYWDNHHVRTVMNSEEVDSSSGI